MGFKPVTTPVWVFCAESNAGFELETQCSFATVYHSLYATVAYPDMQRWHKATDTPSQNCIPGSCGDASGLGTGG